MMCNAHGMQCTLKLTVPIIEEALQLRKLRREIEVLPDIELQKAGMVWKMVVDLGCRQAIPVHLQAEFPADRRRHAFRQAALGQGYR